MIRRAPSGKRLGHLGLPATRQRERVMRFARSRTVTGRFDSSGGTRVNGMFRSIENWDRPADWIGKSMGCKSPVSATDHAQEVPIRVRGPVKLTRFSAGYLMARYAGSTPSLGHRPSHSTWPSPLRASARGGPQFQRRRGKQTRSYFTARRRKGCIP